MTNKQSLEYLQSAFSDFIRVGRSLKASLTTLEVPRVSAEEGTYNVPVAFSFFQRHLDFAEDALVLSEKGRIASLALVARSLTEGHIALLWMLAQSKTSQVRAKRWLAFAWVEDQKEITALKLAGRPIDPNYERQVKAALEEFKKMKLKSGTWRVADDGSRLTVKDMFDDLRAEKLVPRNLYEWYGKLSDFQHWGPFSSHLRYRDDRYVVTEDPNHHLLALRLAMYCFISTCEFIAWAFGMEDLLPSVSDARKAVFEDP